MAASIAVVTSGADFDLTTRDVDISGVPAGQRILIFLAMDDNTGDGVLAVVGAGAEWNMLTDNAPFGAFGGVVKGRAAVAEKIADGGEATVTITCSNAESAAWVVIRVMNFDATTAVAISPDPTIGGFGGLPSLNPAGWGTEPTLWVAFAALDPGYAFALTPPTGYENFTEAHFNANDGTGLAIATRVSDAASEDPDAFTFADSALTGLWTLAIRSGDDGPAPLAFSVRLSGGAANADPALSIGGAQSSVAANSHLFDDVSDSQAVAGLVDYRLVYVHNDEATTDGNVVAYVSGQLESGRELALGAAVEASGVEVAELASDTTAPAGVTFAAPTSSGEGVDLGTVAAGEGKGLFVRRTVNAATAPDITNPAQITFVIDPL